VVLLFRRQVQEHLQVLHLAFLLSPFRQGLEQGASLLEDIGGPGLVVPEFRGGQQFFQMAQPYLLAGQIKDDLGAVATFL
jgi:hypothetical protein